MPTGRSPTDAGARRRWKSCWRCSHRRGNAGYGGRLRRSGGARHERRGVRRRPEVDGARVLRDPRGVHRAQRVADGLALAERTVASGARVRDRGEGVRAHRLRRRRDHRTGTLCRCGRREKGEDRGKREPVKLHFLPPVRVDAETGGGTCAFIYAVAPPALYRIGLQPGSHLKYSGTIWREPRPAGRRDFRLRALTRIPNGRL